jgi:hypothetical protein
MGERKANQREFGLPTGEDTQEDTRGELKENVLGIVETCTDKVSKCISGGWRDGSGDGSVNGSFVLRNKGELP